MNEYTPIERTCPLWITARATIEPGLPRQIVFAQSRFDKSAIAPSDEWAMLILSLTPEEDQPDILHRLSRIDEIFAEYFTPPKESIEQFITQPITQQLLSNLNDLFHQHDEFRRRDGLALYADMVRHEMGIKPTMLEIRKSPEPQKNDSGPVTVIAWMNP